MTSGYFLFLLILGTCEGRYYYSSEEYDDQDQDDFEYDDYSSEDEYYDSTWGADYGESRSYEEDLINSLNLRPEDAIRARGFFRQLVDKAVGATSVVVKGSKKIAKATKAVVRGAKDAVANLAGQARDKVIEKAIEFTVGNALDNPEDYFSAMLANP